METRQFARRAVQDAWRRLRQLSRQSRFCGRKSLPDSTWKEHPFRGTMIAEDARRSSQGKQDERGVPSEAESWRLGIAG